MKSFVSVFLALVFCATSLFAQAPAGGAPKPVEPPKPAAAPAAAAPTKDQAVTRINGPGPAAVAKPGAPATKAGYIPDQKQEPTNLWKIISEGGWIMIPLV
jgi:hypothetical protein